MYIDRTNSCRFRQFLMSNEKGDVVLTFWVLFCLGIPKLVVGIRTTITEARIR